MEAKAGTLLSDLVELAMALAMAGAGVDENY
jgi:hypothetical protein